MRQAAHLRQRYGAVVAHVGAVSALAGLLMLLPLAAGLVAPLGPRTVLGFLIPAIALLVTGVLVRRRLRVASQPLTREEGGVIVVLGWLVVTVAGAVPLLVVERLCVTHALFESVSGWTTTGLSILTVGEAEPSILLWRSIMQLAGGAGLAIIMLASLTSVEGPSLAAAEGRAELLAPHVRASMRLVLRLYGAEVALGIIALRLVGMGWFDSVNHSLCALPTGGFSTKPASIGHWDAPAIEAVTMALMLLGSTNFVTLWCVLRGRWKAVAGNGELRLTALVLPVTTVVLLLATAGPLYGFAPKGVRVAAFETVSALTTTGYSTVSYGPWNATGLLLLITLMLIGGAACSTAGGIKQYRIHLLFRSLVRELKRPLLPRGAVLDDATWEGEERVPLTDARVRAVGTYLFLYLGTWLLGAAVLAAHGASLPDALFEFASALGTVGLSVGLTHADAPALVLWTEILGMLLGRLEFFVLFVGTAKIVRDARRLARRELQESAPPPGDRSGGAR